MAVDSNQTAHESESALSRSALFAQIGLSEVYNY